MNECGFMLIILEGLEPSYNIIATPMNFAINNHKLALLKIFDGFGRLFVEITVGLIVLDISVFCRRINLNMDNK